MSQVAELVERQETHINVGRLFAASCVALSGSAIMFAVLGDIINPLKRQFILTNWQAGWIAAGSGWGFTIGIFALGPLCDALGMRLLLWFAFLCQALGVTVMIAAGAIGGFWMLFWGATLHMIGGGTVEAVCNPLIATLYPNEKTHKLNQFHMWFPGGIVIGGLACYFLAKAHLDSWQLRLLVVLIPAVIFAVMIVGQRFPATERVQSGVSFGGMFRETLLRPLFLVLLVCMTMTASLELGPEKWIPSVLQSGGVPGILVLVWITGLMAILRFFAGPVVKTLGNIGLLLVSAILSGTGLLLLSFGGSYFTIALAATIFALGVCYFWPTMLGTAAERVPKGGALALALLGGTGGLVNSVVTTPLMGAIADRYVHKELVSPQHEPQTIATLQGVVTTYSQWEQTLGVTAGDAVARREAADAIDSANDVLATYQRTGSRRGARRPASGRGTPEPRRKPRRPHLLPLRRPAVACPDRRLRRPLRPPFAHPARGWYNLPMTVPLTLPKEVEQRLLAEVKAGRHASLEEVILEKLSRPDDLDVLAASGMDAHRLRRDLDDAWQDRHDAVDGEAVFRQIAAKSESLKAQGK